MPYMLVVTLTVRHNLKFKTCIVIEDGPVGTWNLDEHGHC
jgi:hypothetical protein